MRRMSKASPTESPLLFEVDPKPLEESLTALGGIPLVVQAFRSLGLPGGVQKNGAGGERAEIRGCLRSREAVRRNHVRREFCDFERGGRRVRGRFRTPAQRCG